MDLVLHKEVMIWSAMLLIVIFPPAVLMALEGLNSKSDKTYGFMGKVLVESTLHVMCGCYLNIPFGTVVQNWT